ncbi:MAG TPA: ATP-dependent DNA helicase UvrD2, partial [Acidimicrobiales bacterium]|nr:ATP-dependent DNA helicase UvrD2 [Acidimicrobiales bacterium]
PAAASAVVRVPVTAPGPPGLGRGVVVGAGDPVPPPWSGVPEVTVDRAALDVPPGEASPVVDRLHDHWASRRPVVVRLAVDPAELRAPRSYTAEEVGDPWLVDPGFDPVHDRLHFLLWANTYDARGAAEPVWWWGRKALRAGASPGGGTGDVLLPDGTPAWVDGGPRGDDPGALAGGAAVVPSEAVEAGHVRAAPVHRPPGADLAADQLAAVAHGSGPARVIAPAGSGKTRVLTERLRHLVVDRGYEPASVVAVAYNRKARDEMVARTPGVGGRLLTLNALGYDVVTAGLGRRPEVLDERRVRHLIEPLVPTGARRLNTDPLAPYLEALTTVRLGLRPPLAVEDERGDVPGLADAVPRFRAALAREGAVDFDEQVLLAVELLLRDGAFRRAQQARHRHLLVDELQDLTPAHVLLVRLLAAPAFDVFGVGDDDQVIYGHAGASPRFLTDFGSYFPGAQGHALEVNYRCPAPVVGAVGHLLTRNRARVPKVVRAARPDDDPGALQVLRHPPQDGAAALVDVVRGWLDGPGAVAPADVAVLARVGSLLLAPHVALGEAGIPVQSVLRPDVLGRTGLRAALAYLRIAGSPAAFDPADLVEVHRRPSRGLPRWADRWLSRCRSIDDVRRASQRIDDAKVAGKLDDLASDLAGLAAVARTGITRRVLEHVRDVVGLAGAVDLLDATGGGDGQSHHDDLDALLQVADLHPEPTGFAPWLRDALARLPDADGVTLSTVHRVKGREWPRVALYGATDGVMPHRLGGPAAVPEERRVFHVALTRGMGRVAVLGDASRPSPFLDELRADATADELSAAGRAEDAPSAGPRGAGAGGAGTARSGPGGAPRRRGAGEGRARAGVPVPAASGPEAARLEAALRQWRKERSTADGVPAYVVVNDRHLMGIAERRPATRGELAACPGIGPAKLAAYGDEILALVATAGAAADGG